MIIVRECVPRIIILLIIVYKQYKDYLVLILMETHGYLVFNFYKIFIVKTSFFE